MEPGSLYEKVNAAAPVWRSNCITGIRRKQMLYASPGSSFNGTDKAPRGDGQSSFNSALFNARSMRPLCQQAIHPPRGNRHVNRQAKAATTTRAASAGPINLASNQDRISLGKGSWLTANRTSNATRIRRHFGRHAVKMWGRPSALCRRAWAACW